MISSESAESYEATWKTFKTFLVSFPKKFRPCSDNGCFKCVTILQVLQHEESQKFMRLDTFRREKRVAVDYASYDYSLAWKAFCRARLGLDARQCMSHLTGESHLSFHALALRCFFFSYRETERDSSEIL